MVGNPRRQTGLSSKENNKLREELANGEEETSVADKIRKCLKIKGQLQIVQKKATEEEIEFVEECERIKSWKAEALKIVKQRKAAEDARKRREAERKVV